MTRASPDTRDAAEGPDCGAPGKEVLEPMQRRVQATFHLPR